MHYLQCIVICFEVLFCSADWFAYGISYAQLSFKRRESLSSLKKFLHCSSYKWLRQVRISIAKCHWHYEMIMRQFFQILSLYLIFVYCILFMCVCVAYWYWWFMLCQGVAGGLTNLSKLPACNIQVIGAQKRTLSGFSTKAIMPHTGFVYYCDIVQKTPPVCVDCTALL